MTFKQQAPKTLGALGAVSAGLLGALALASPASAEIASIPINPGNVPTTAADFEQSCDQVPDSIAADQDGWVFVLPASAGVEGNFETVYAVFEDASGGTHEFNTNDDGGIVDGQGDNKAYIVTPAGWTLVAATADVESPDADAKFNLTHACAGTPTEGGEESPTPGGSESPSDEATSPSPGDSESPAPSEEATTPAGSTLPTTGTPLTVALVSAAALAAAGVALFVVMKRRRAAENW